MQMFRFILFILGVLIEQVHILEFSENTSFFSYGALPQHPFSHCVFTHGSHIMKNWPFLLFWVRYMFLTAPPCSFQVKKSNSASVFYVIDRSFAFSHTYYLPLCYESTLSECDVKCSVVGFNNISDRLGDFHFASMLLDHWNNILIQINVSLHSY